MPDIVAAEIERYAENHTTPPPPYLEALAEETRSKLSAPGMMVGPVEGRVLEMLVFISAARRVLEIGTFTGYSALSMAAGLPDDGHIVTCEVDPRHAEMARLHISASPFADAWTLSRTYFQPRIQFAADKFPPPGPLPVID